jgi:hypothetical protein
VKLLTGNRSLYLMHWGGGGGGGGGGGVLLIVGSTWHIKQW